MSNELTPEKLDELRRLLANVTPKDLEHATRSERDEWCRAEDCRWRRWRSGSIPTHRKGADCPEQQKQMSPVAEFIAAAVNALPALLDAAAERDALAAAVERVRALHWIDDDDSGKWCGYCQSDFDAAQADEWYPCATIRALDESEADK